MDTSDQPSAPEQISSTAIPIAQLSPDVDRLQRSSIHAVVTLLWPYSSFSKSLTLLLAEPDFRLRRSNGQVKVCFHEDVAEEVARTHIGIGDTVNLNLSGSRFAKNDAAAQTPGKGVSWDVHFDTSAFLEVILGNTPRIVGNVLTWYRSGATPSSCQPSTSTAPGLHPRPRIT